MSSRGSVLLSLLIAFLRVTSTSAGENGLWLFNTSEKPVEPEREGIDPFPFYIVGCVLIILSGILVVACHQRIFECCKRMDAFDDRPKSDLIERRPLNLSREDLEELKKVNTKGGKQIPSIIVSNPENVVITIDGEKVPLAEGTELVVLKNTSDDSGHPRSSVELSTQTGEESDEEEIENKDKYKILYPRKWKESISEESDQEEEFSEIEDANDSIDGDKGIVIQCDVKIDIDENEAQDKSKPGDSAADQIRYRAISETSYNLTDEEGREIIILPQTAIDKDASSDRPIVLTEDSVIEIGPTVQDEVDNTENDDDEEEERVILKRSRISRRRNSSVNRGTSTLGLSMGKEIIITPRIQHKPSLDREPSFEGEEDSDKLITSTSPPEGTPKEEVKQIIFKRKPSVKQEQTFEKNAGYHTTDKETSSDTGLNEILKDQGDTKNYVEEREMLCVPRSQLHSEPDQGQTLEEKAPFRSADKLITSEDHIDERPEDEFNSQKDEVCSATAS